MKNTALVSIGKSKYNDGETTYLKRKEDIQQNFELDDGTVDSNAKHHLIVYILIA